MIWPLTRSSFSSINNKVRWLVCYDRLLNCWTIYFNFTCVHAWLNRYLEWTVWHRLTSKWNVGCERPYCVCGKVYSVGSVLVVCYSWCYWNTSLTRQSDIRLTWKSFRNCNNRQSKTRILKCWTSINEAQCKQIYYGLQKEEIQITSLTKRGKIGGKQ